MTISPVTSRASMALPRNAAGGAAATSSDQDQQVQKLKARDADVRRHEEAHVAAAGPLAKGGPQYDYQVGPDGKEYAVGGHVDIDTSSVPGDPKATAAKMEQVRRAALAPADPSGQDQAVAAKAAAELAKAQQAESQDAPGPTNGASAGRSNRAPARTSRRSAAASAYTASSDGSSSGGSLDLIA